MQNEITIPPPSSRKRLIGIAPEAYRHPSDQQATATLRSVPGFELAVSKLSQHGVEQFVYVQMCASAVKVTERQCSRIHDLLLEACAVLDVQRVPALFLSQNPIVNAFALGRDNPTMVLHTGLVEHLTDEELLGVIGHELGHIHCGHTIYLLMLILLQQAAKLGGARFGMGDLFSLPIQMALLEWSRKAEFSADRASILVTQNAETVFSSLFKLTGGSPKVFAQMDREEYLKQAEEYDRDDKGRLNNFYKTLLEGGQTHPIPVLRSREVLRWGESDDFKAILSGRYPARDKNGGIAAAPSAPIVCPDCGRDTDTAFSFCTHCGASVRAPGALPVVTAKENETHA